MDTLVLLAQEGGEQVAENQLGVYAEYFINIFRRGADTFVAFVTGFVPLVIILLTAVNAIIQFVGQERVNQLAEFASRDGLVYTPLRFLVLPVVSVFLLTNPICYSGGVFLQEKNKPAFYDSAVSFVHPITGLFPHANAGELFVFIGVASGIQRAGGSLTSLAVWYLITGLIVIFLRGIVTQTIFNILRRRRITGAEAQAQHTGGV